LKADITYSDAFDGELSLKNKDCELGDILNGVAQLVLPGADGRVEVDCVE